MKHTIKTLIVAVAMYIAAVIMAEEFGWHGDVIESLFCTIGIAAATIISISVLVLIYQMDHKNERL